MQPFILLEMPADTFLPDLWKTIVLTLFILSMINERITNFIKLNIESILTRLLGFSRYERLFNDKTNFKLPETDPEKEKERERGIVNFALICGFFVASSCGADLLFLVETGGLLRVPNMNKFWDIRETLAALYRHGVGFLLTAFFISLGSKFWHELLDVLMATSNLKEKLGERADWKFSKIEEVDTYLLSYEIDPIRNALNDAENKFRVPGVLGYGIKMNATGNYYIEVLIADASVVIDTSLTYLHPTGRVRSVPIVVVQSGMAIPLLQPAAEIGNTGTFRNSGTLGCIVQYKGTTDPCLLTCYHVVRTPNQKWDYFDQSKGDSVIESPDDTNQIIGRILEGKRSLTADIAIIKPDVNLIIDSTIPEIGPVKMPRKLTESDLNKTVVRKSGKNFRPGPDGTLVRKTTGQIVSLSHTLKVNYGNGDIHTLYNLIQIKSNSPDSFVLPGDSGSLVVDEHNYGIGIVVAKDDSSSYAIPLTSVFNQFNLEFNNSLLL